MDQFLPQGLVGASFDQVPRFREGAIIETTNAIYEISSLLGGGAFGSVYSATIEGIVFGSEEMFIPRGLEVGSPVALKFQSAEDTKSEREILMYMNAVRDGEETCQVATCLIDSDIEGDLGILVIELLDYARDLESVKKTLALLPRNQATRLIRSELIVKMLFNVSVLHDYKVFHRDLKLPNIVVGEIDRASDEELVAVWEEVAVAKDDAELIFGDSDTTLERYVKLRLNSREIDETAERAFVEEFLIGSDRIVVKLIDFGLGKTGCRTFNVDGSASLVGSTLSIDPWFFASVRSGYLTGTTMFSYYPYPEETDDNCNREEQIWRLVDTWSLGIAAYEMFHGKLPFTLKSQFAQTSLRAHRAAHLVGQLNPEVSAEWVQDLVFVSSAFDFDELMANLTLSDADNPREGAIDMADPGAPFEPELEALKAEVREITSEVDAIKAELETAEDDKALIQLQLRNMQRNLTRAKETYREKFVLFKDARAIVELEPLLEIYPPHRPLDLGLVIRRFIAALE